MSDQVPFNRRVAVGSVEPGIELDLTVIICTYNRYSVLSDAIASLESQSLPAAQFEILIVDNSSDEQAQKEFWSTHTVPGNGHLFVDRVAGLSRARNTGL